MSTHIDALKRIKYEAASLAEAQVIALEALSASKPEPQAQAGEPKVAAYAGNNGEIFPTTHGYDVLHVGADLITLQSHREAMAEQHEIEAQLSGQLDATSRACTEKDAALKACVEAQVRSVIAWQGRTPLGSPRPDWVSQLEDAATQAKRALK